MRFRSKVALAVLAIMLAGAALLLTGWAGNLRAASQKTKTKEASVYVCACMGTKSCACMSEAKTEGPCACGTQGGPPMKQVKADSAWAKENRDALAGKSK
jgi:hypothetical protein